MEIIQLIHMKQCFAMMLIIVIVVKEKIMSNKSELIKSLRSQKNQLDVEIKELTYHINLLDYDKEELGKYMEQLASDIKRLDCNIEDSSSDIDDLNNEIQQYDEIQLEKENIQLRQFEIQLEKDNIEFRQFELKLKKEELELIKENIACEICIIQRINPLPSPLVLEIIKQLILSNIHNDMVCVPIEQFTSEEMTAACEELQAKGLYITKRHWDVLREEAYCADAFHGGIKDIKSRYLKIDCESVELGGPDNIIDVFNSDVPFPPKEVVPLEDITAGSDQVEFPVRKKCVSMSSLYDLAALQKNNFWAQSKSFSTPKDHSPISVTAPSPFEAIGR